MIFICEYTSDGLGSFHTFQVCCIVIAVLAWLSLTYTGRRCHTQFELQQLKNSDCIMNSGYTDRSTNLPIWRLTWQLITQRNFISFVTTNLLSEFHRSYLINFANIFCETLIPETALPPFIRSCFFGWFVVSPQVCIGGSRGGVRDARPPWASKFFRFHAVFGKIWRVHAPLEGSRPPSGKSWIRHWYVLSALS